MPEFDENDEMKQGQSSDLNQSIDEAVDGTLVVPVNRVKLIYDTVPEVLPLSPDGAAALAIACEVFAEDLLKQCFLSSEDGAIDYDVISALIRGSDEMSWLHEFVPERKTYAEALSIIKRKEE